MLCTRRTSDLGPLLIFAAFFMSDSTMSQFSDGEKMKQSNTTPPTTGNTSLSVLVNTKAVLPCPPCPLTTPFMVTWKILFRDNTICTKAYSEEKNETTDTNCTDNRITWISRPDQNTTLQIDPVAITHEGTYICEMVSPEGNFCHDYHLQVLAPPQVTIYLTKNRTVVCKAATGKPAAQIFWIPEGSCVTEQEIQGHGAVSVQSECHWENSSVSPVTCFVSHLTGNKTLSQELHSGGKTSYIMVIMYVTLPILVLIIVLSIWFWKTTGCRKCKWRKAETIEDFEEGEMQPYASYTEKSNPLYDTARKVKTSQVPQNGMAGMDLHKF